MSTEARVVNADVVLAALDAILHPMSSHRMTHLSIMRHRVKELRDQVDSVARGQVTPDREALERAIADAIDTGIGEPRDDSYAYWRKEAVAVADAIIALFNEKGNE